MIIVNFYKDKQGYIKRYVISGHSDYDEYGRDIVCSAVSILSQTALMSFVSVCKVDEDDLIYSIDEDGFLDVSIPENLDDKTREEIQIIMKTMEVGIKSIIENYPENVTLKYREV